jgi:predicted phosphodiesterase
VVIFGHSHAALVERADGVLYLNPSAAGPRRFSRPRTVARLLIAPAGAEATAADACASAGPRLQAEILVAESQEG